ncbi:uncharacterized protein LOC113306484 [Papaver somniferum]|uniref:uncharacterized protein LOC113306484 n=1 Tax=Papaver somniferum TaxID=3469 RepID=UPI000E6FB635|nr:uncharacterized protein LOC113306484 [Papaver somniferum]
MGFGENWRKWIICCVEYVKFPVLINGSANGYFTCKKRIRQGDPIFPFLFLLVGEDLTFMIKRAQEQGIISGFQVKSDGLNISHLQFSDDTLIFLDADVDQVRNLRAILISFELLTGLKINFAKSQIFGVGFEGDLSIFSSIFDYYSGCLPTTYLGLPLGDKYGGVAKWDKIIEKFLSKLAGWKKPLLSGAGKIQLIKNILASLPLYFMSLYEIPNSVIKKLEKIMKDFLCHDNKGRRKLHLVKWLALSRKKKQGELGIKNLKRMNQALLTKWSWRYAVEDESLWKSIVEEKYGSGETIWIPKNPTCIYGRSVWRYIMNHNSSFLKFVRFKVNDGSMCRFWDDNWIYDSLIKTCYPNLYAQSRSKHSSVAELGFAVGDSVTWNLHTPTRLNAAART